MGDLRVHDNICLAADFSSAKREDSSCSQGGDL